MAIEERGEALQRGPRDASLVFLRRIGGMQVGDVGDPDQGRLLTIPRLSLSAPWSLITKE